MGKKQLIYDYQQYLLGNSEKVRACLLEGSVIETEKMAKDILRYVIEDILGWSPLEMQYKFSEYYVDAFKLKPVLSAFILPEEADEEDYTIYSYLLYPNKVDMSLAKLVIKEYNLVFSSNGSRRTPSSFFKDENGKERAMICLRYLIETSDSFASLADTYDFFSNSCMSYLSKMHLKNPCFEYWESPLEFLHDSLPPSSESELFYHIYKVAAEVEKIRN